MEKRGNVEFMVRNTAKNPISGRLNLVQYKNEKKKALLHKSVCESVVEFADNNPTMPFYAVLSVGVGSGSFKTTEYNKGYKYFNAEKTKSCMQMANMYNKVLGIKGKPSDVTWRLVNRYYNRVSHNVSDFVDAINRSNKTLDGKRGHFKELCSVFGM